MKVKDLKDVFEDRQYIQIYSNDLMSAIFSEYDGKFGDLNSDYYYEKEIAGIRIYPRIVTSKDGNEILRTVMVIYIKD